MTILLDGLLIVGLILCNAFFAAAEYALLSVRRTRIEQLVREGNASARLVQGLLADIGLLISGTQLGVTVISLLMGWLGESMMAAAVEVALEGRLDYFASVMVAHTISVAVAFLIITVILMVLGELVPKALAYERAEQTSLIVARPMLYFIQLSRPLVRAVDGLADIVLRGLGQSPGQAHGGQHTPEEAKLIVSAIRKRGMLGIEQEEMIHGVFDLHRMLVQEVMVPRPKITCLQLSKDLNHLLERIVDDQHSRIPIYEGLPDHIIGILYTKDLLRVALDRHRMGLSLDAPFDLRSILHSPMIVPESMSLNQMLKDARRKHSQLALVVDEFGTFVGLVTIEDVLEQIVGEIQDEYDREEVVIRKIGADVFEVDASISLRDFADDYQISLPREAGYATLAGFVLARLGLIPKGGESFIFEGRRYSVTEMDGRRVARIKVEKAPAKPARPTASETAAKVQQVLPGKSVKL
ncbi:MAG TPA: hemolysin family protein [Terriglobia bacterium]|nr:hemolysin family protein [Terriglobia bacterium]